MSQYTSIVRDLSSDKFAEILGHSARKAREVYFHRHGIKKSKKSNMLSKRGKGKEDRAVALHDALLAEEDEEMVEELLRTWLLGKRELLSAALDHLEIDHNEGLTESDDVKKFEELKGKPLKDLLKKLDAVAPPEDVRAYLRFMGVVADNLS